jgi:regulator of protease activity HflC (stomatin/prohibitin superfamily)
METVDSDEIMVLQDPFDGELHVYSSAGMYWQGFGKVTKYKKSDTLWFSNKDGSCAKSKASIPTRFNDGANGWVCGSLRYELPRDEKSMIALHETFGTLSSIEAQLVNPVIQKSVYMSGPLMNSKESYAERRTDLIQYIKDQTELGVYKTRTESRRVSVNNLGVTGEDDANTRFKTVEVAVISMENGVPARQEASPLSRFGIKVYNFSITGIRYDNVVEKQIEKQQIETMEVQTSIAQAKKEEQRTRTEIARGKADAEKARWEQEVTKARATTLAEQEKSVAVTNAERIKEVSVLARDAAKMEKERQILLGEGEATRKTLVMKADGALAQKLDAWKQVNFKYADQIGKQRWVPNVVMGGSNNSSGGSGAQGVLDLFMVKTARELSLDLSMDK